GRSQATATKLTDPSVSRVHCEIDFDGHRAVLVNISGNGTLVNGKSVSKHELRHGDMVRVGGTEFRFQRIDVEEAETVLQPPHATPRPHAADQLSALPGQQLSHYHIEEVIAKGQSGMVFKATDSNDNRTVALKVLQPEFSGNE